MRVYLIDKNTNEIIKEYNNVIEYNEDYILYQAGKGRGKLYAGENEYFTNIKPE